VWKVVWWIMLLVWVETYVVVNNNYWQYAYRFKKNIECTSGGRDIPQM
jgi:hypothetical protein